tara:strand:- start:2797 stop:3684 length:888 start_codon:yes stop_codon:yes gene_type:complete
MNLFKKIFALSASVALLSACASNETTPLEDLSVYNDEFKDYKINVFLKSFSDHRQGSGLLLPNGSDIVYAYKPQSVTSGQMLPLLGYYLYKSVDFENKKAPRSVGVDVSLRYVETAIRHGGLPVTRLGYYSAEVQARVIVRDMVNNEIIDTFPILVSDSKIRSTSTGRAPSTQEDKYQMLALLDNVSIKLADEVLAETADILEDYYRYEEVEEMFEMQEDFKSLADDKYTTSIFEKTKSVKVDEVEEESLGATPEMIDFIESEEQKLLDRKEAQRKLFEKKLEDQKYLDFLDKQQ